MPYGFGCPKRLLPIYAQHGGPHASLVDPILRTPEGLRLERGLWSILRDAQGR
jgi:hypothetical protein